MANMNIYDIDTIQNVNVRRVWDLLVKVLEDDSSICTCRDCVLDIAAITLNKIPPHYQILDENYDEAYRKVSDEEILNQIKLAAEKVKLHPHHL